LIAECRTARALAEIAEQEGTSPKQLLAAIVASYVVDYGRAKSTAG
jgi:hypothetical protein